MLLDNTTNAACPMRPTWQISDVGYEWAQVVFCDKPEKAKKVKNTHADIDCSIYELEKTVCLKEKSKNENTVIILPSFFMQTSRN